MFSFIRDSIAVKLSLFISVLVFLTAIVVSTFFYIGEVYVFVEREFDVLEQDSLFVERSFTRFNRRARAQVQKLASLLQDIEKTKVWADSQEIPATIYTFNSEKTLIFQLSSENSRKYDYSKKFLNKKRQANKKIERSPVFYASLDKELLRPALPLIQYTYKFKEGYVVVVYEFQNIFKELRRQVTSDKSIILFDNRGAILFHPNAKKYANQINESWYNIKNEFEILNDIPFLDEKKNQVIKNITNYRGEKYITVFTKSPVINFVLYKTRDSVFEKIIDIKEQIVLMTFF